MQDIETQLNNAFNLEHLTLENQSYFHRHHKQSGEGKHFAVTLVSADFEGLNSVKRHQKVYAALGMPGNKAIHALSIAAFTPAQWEQQKEALLTS